MTNKVIKVKSETLQRLQNLKQSRGDSYENVLLRLLNKYEGLM